MPKGVYDHQHLIGNKHRLGKPPWNKGLHIYLGGKRFEKGQLPWNAGKKYSGNSGKKHTDKWKELMSQKMIGKKYPQTSGKNHWRWKEDRTQLCRISKQGERRTSTYFNWRKEVWKRDNYQCRINNCDCKGKIIAHHILSWKDYPELRYEINNGITLCQAHHPRKRAEEKRLIPFFQGLATVLNV